MKRVVIIALAVMVVLSFAACQKRDDNDRNDTAVTTGRIQTAEVSPSPNANGQTPDAERTPDADGNGGADTAQENMTFTGAVSSIDGRTVVVKPDDGEDIKNSGDRISVRLADDHNFIVGDRVRVTYHGVVTDGDPASVNAVKIEEID